VLGAPVREGVGRLLEDVVLGVLQRTIVRSLMRKGREPGAPA
jgi:hypothetical protein